MDLGSGQETSFQDGMSHVGFHVTSHDEYHVTGRSAKKGWNWTGEVPHREVVTRHVGLRADLLPS